VLKQLDESDACPALWETEAGEFWSMPEDGDLLDFLLTEQLLAAVYQRGPVAVREGDVVLDVGSHLGVFTRMALRKGARIVVAIEPAPRNIACFKKTFAPELAAGRVIMVEAAAWSESATLHFEVDDGYHGSARGHVGSRGQLAVPAVTIDDTVNRLGLNAVDFIKMDIEGAERFALRGAAGTIARFHPKLAICVYHGDDDRGVVPDVVRAIRPEYDLVATRFVDYFH
jgi:FkbM family methyltransferase